MAGRHSFSELRAKMSPEARARAEQKALALGREMDLAELRRALRLSQEELAQTLQVGQAAVAKIEKRADMYVSTLRRFVEAMGGELQIVARFRDHEVQIRTFREIGDDRKAKSDASHAAE